MMAERNSTKDDEGRKEGRKVWGGRAVEQKEEGMEDGNQRGREKGRGGRRKKGTPAQRKSGKEWEGGMSNQG